jgi:MscS family membrane protein
MSQLRDDRLLASAERRRGSSVVLPPILTDLWAHDLSWWQWLGLPLTGVAAWIVGAQLGRFTRAVAARLLRRASGRDAQLDQLTGPVTLVWATFLLWPATRWLRLDGEARGSIHSALRAIGLFAFFWALSRAIDVGRSLVIDSSWGRGHPVTRSLMPLGVKIGKVLVIALGVVALLSELGYSVTTLVAGLGVGGVAVALGAQKTLENLFGALALGTDQPFLVGDYVRIGDVQGNVEATGLRSTRIRTPDRTLITIPNGKLADQQIESMAVRDRLRFGCRIGLVYSTRPEQVRAVLAGLEAALRAQPKLWPNDIMVRFVGFGDWSLNIEVNAYFATLDYGEFLLLREATLLAFMDVVERAGSALALPTRTLHVIGEKPMESTAETRGNT